MQNLKSKIQNAKLGMRCTIPISWAISKFIHIPIFNFEFCIAPDALRKTMCRAIILLMLLSFVPAAHAVRIKDVTHVEGIRDNQLIGVGLVVGLNGTGDGSSTN